MRIRILAICLFIPMTVLARSTREASYRYDQIWNTMVRFIRVDNGFKITEKDKESGYLMFDYTEGVKSQIGAVEVVEIIRNQRLYVTVGLRIQNMPSYVELHLLDKLERKLRDEYGDPPIPPLIVSSGEEREKARSEERYESDTEEKTDKDASK